jgi:adenylate kinase
LKLRVVVVGIPGVGKTTIVDKLAHSLKDAGLVTFGTVMLQEAERRRWVKHRDELRSLTVARQGALQRIAASKISRMKRSTVLVDTHLFIRTPEGFWPGLPFDVVRALRPTHLILIEASPDEIAARRAADRSRYRDSVDRDALVRELELARGFLSVASSISGAPMLVVNNHDGEVNGVAAGLAKVLRRAGQ